MRLIDADVLHDTILRDEKLDGKDVNWAVNRIISHILNAPTIDTTFKEVVAYECGQKSVEERPKGEWIGSNGVKYTFPNSYNICSNCKIHSNKFYIFCPNCGARMEFQGEG